MVQEDEGRRGRMTVYDASDDARTSDTKVETDKTKVRGTRRETTSEMQSGTTMSEARTR